MWKWCRFDLVWLCLDVPVNMFFSHVGSKHFLIINYEFEELKVSC